MKKLSVLLLSLILALYGCNSGGDISNVKTPEIESEIYSSSDIDAAVKVIIKEFDSNWDGCTLTELCYAGDELTLQETKASADTYNVDEIIVLTSSFKVDGSGGDGSLNPNSTYTDWLWILGRSRGKKWKHLDHGYC